jgi:thioredoxin-dependent peroxiredoxin
MPELHEGDLAPEFALTGTDGEVRLSTLLREGPVVVTFYQEDDTPTCRSQLAAFRDDYEVVQELGATLVAISVDSLDAHARFAETLDAPFPLLADDGGDVARAYGVYDETSRRSNRAIFVVGQDGSIARAIPWYNPANPSQYEQVFQALGVDV